jgi:TonB family protein
MMPEIDRAMLAVGGSLAASTLVKATVATALALIGARLAYRSRAAVRHALLAAAFGVLLALPVACIVVAPVRIAVPVVARAASPTAGAIAVSHLTAADAAIGVTPSISQSSARSPSALLFGVWIFGAVLFLLPMAVGLRQVRSLRQAARPWPLGQPAVERLAIEAGIHRRVAVLLHEALPGPMTCGIAHPAIVLPVNAQSWGAEDLNRAIVHELEHVRRGDWAIHCFARAVCAAYWFHPLVWIAWRQLALEAERSCDDAVLGRSEATAYADQLVGLARRLSVSAKVPVLAMANRADLTTRVSAVLDGRQRRGRAGAIPVALACAAAVALVLTLSPLRTVAAQQSSGAHSRPVAAAQLAVGTNLVIEAVKVSDLDGKSLEELKASDFAVTEDGVAQTISIFEFQKLNDIPAGKQDSVSSYYILGYYAENPNLDGKFRKVQITLNGNATAKLDYRPGYYANKLFTRADSGQNAGAAGSAAFDELPRLLRKVEPAYSEEARKAKYQGYVPLVVEVDTSGQVINPRVIRSLGLGLDEEAIEAVKQWKFAPAIKDGKPVAAQVQVAFEFRLL